jgi:hypothetical protein
MKLFQVSDLQNIIQQMERARDSGDLTKMERICRNGVNQGLQDEYLLRSLSWCLLKQRRFVESYEVAQQNWKVNPCAWSLTQYIESAHGSGDWDDAKKAARHLEQNSQYWGSVASAAQSAIDKVATKTFTFTWTIDPTKDCFQKHNAPDVRVPLPRTGMVY